MTRRFWRGLLVITLGLLPFAWTADSSDTCRKSSGPPPFSKNGHTELTMRAAQVKKFGGEENVKLEYDVTIPSPADNEVLINMKAAGVNPADLIYREGNFPGIKLPFTAGIDGAGVVAKTGKAVTKFIEGDRVVAAFTSGSYAEFATAKEIHVSHLPEETPFEQGAGIGIPYYTAYAAVHFRANTQPGETVLVHGASGGVGIACIQVLKAHGCRVVGTAGTPEGEEHVKQHGADFVYNHHSEGYMDRIKSEVTRGGGVDVILEMTAAKNLHNDLKLAAVNGRVVIIGTHGNVEINPLHLLVKQALVVGVNLYSTTDEEWNKMHAALIAGQKFGWLKPYIGKIYNMNEARIAQHDLVHVRGVKGKLVINTSIHQKEGRHTCI